MAHGFICPRLLSLSWDTNTHNEHIYFQFDVQNGRGLHEGSHFHYKNQKHKHSEIHPKRPWSRGVLITRRQTLRLSSPCAGRTLTNFIAASSRLDSPLVFTALRWVHGCHHSRGRAGCSGGWWLSLGGMARGWTRSSDPDTLRWAIWTASSSLRSLSCRFYFCKLELVLSGNIFVSGL